MDQGRVGRKQVSDRVDARLVKCLFHGHGWQVRRQCPDKTYIILAAISLPGSESMAITCSDIDNWEFRQ